jgi:toxin HigB-1
MVSRLSWYMIRSFRDQATEDIFYGRRTKLARRTLPQALWRQGAKKLDALQAAAVLGDLRIPPGNRLEVLKGDRKGEHSIRINDQYRICFRWTPNGAKDVQVVDYH